MHCETTEEVFDHDNGLTVVNGVVQIEEHEGLAESGRELVPRFALVDAPSGVSH
jgi:hypothetical protein